GRACTSRRPPHPGRRAARARRPTEPPSPTAHGAFRPSRRGTPCPARASTGTSSRRSSASRRAARDVRRARRRRSTGPTSPGGWRAVRSAVLQRVERNRKGQHEAPVDALEARAELDQVPVSERAEDARVRPYLLAL